MQDIRAFMMGGAKHPGKGAGEEVLPVLHGGALELQTSWIVEPLISHAGTPSKQGKAAKPEAAIASPAPTKQPSGKSSAKVSGFRRDRGVIFTFVCDARVRYHSHPTAEAQA